MQGLEGQERLHPEPRHGRAADIGHRITFIFLIKIIRHCSWCCRDSRAKNTPTQSHVTVGRLTSGVEYARPLGVGWRGTFGLNWQRATCFNQHMVPITQVGAASSDWTSWWQGLCWTCAVHGLLISGRGAFNGAHYPGVWPHECDVLNLRNTHRLLAADRSALDDPLTNWLARRLLQPAHGACHTG